MNTWQTVKRAAEIYLCQKRSLYALYWFFRHSPRLEQFRDKHKGEDCFIMGNGPSLNKMDLTLLNNYHVFGLNKIFLLLGKVNLNLSYHVAVNPFVIEQSKQQIESLQCPSFLSYFPAKDTIAPLPHIHFLLTGGGPLKFHRDMRNFISEGWTVTYIALQLAYYMGFKRVFLIGVDHNFQAQGKPNETQFMQEDDKSHFDPNYFKGNYWQLPDLAGSEIAYHFARFHYEKDNRKIYDATVGGKLQIYEKIDFDVALKMCSKKSRVD